MKINPLYENGTVEPEPEYTFESLEEIAKFAAQNIGINEIFTDDEVADHLLDEAGWSLADFAQHTNLNMMDELLGALDTEDILQNIEGGTGYVKEFVANQYSAEDVFGLEVIVQEITDNYSVDDIFESDQLGDWAEYNGYINRGEEIEEIRHIFGYDYDDAYGLVLKMYHQPILNDTRGPIKYAQTVLKALRDRQRKLNAQMCTVTDKDELGRLSSEHAIAESAFLDILSQCRKLTKKDDIL